MTAHTHPLNRSATYLSKSDKISPQCRPFSQSIPKVLILWVEFRELSHLTRDLSQAEKKINVVIQAEQMHKMVEVVILSKKKQLSFRQLLSL